MIRVAHVIEGDFASDYFSNLARYVDPSTVGLELLIFGSPRPDRAEELRQLGVPIRLLSTEKRYTVPALFRLALALRRVDVVHAHLFKPSLAALIIATTLAPRARRVLGRHYAELHHRLGRPVHVYADRLSSRLAHVIVANSDWTRQVLTSWEHVDERKVRVIPHGIETSPKGPEQLGPLRTEFGVDATGDSTIVLLAPGRLDPLKGHEFSIRALRRLMDTSSRDWLLLIAGEGPHRSVLEELISELALDKNVRLIGFRDDLQALYQLADVVLVPSLSEAFGQVVIEAMAASSAVVATNVGAIPELLDHGATGLLVEAEDPEAIADAVTLLVAQPELAESLRRRARRDVERRFSARRVAEAHEALYVALATGT